MGARREKPIGAVNDYLPNHLQWWLQAIRPRGRRGKRIYQWEGRIAIPCPVGVHAMFSAAARRSWFLTWCRVSS